MQEKSRSMRHKIVIISTPDRGHVQRALLVTRGLVAAGAEVHAFCGTEFSADFRREGAEFHDLHAGRPLESADNSSIPLPSRYVTFAAVYAESLINQIARLRPSLIVHGTFAVVAMVVAQSLDLPRVAICAGHNQSPRVALPLIAQDARVKLSTACLEAVRVLRDRYGMANASQFSYLDSLSSTLNIIPEPPDFLREDESVDFYPAAFFGCIDPIRSRTVASKMSPPGPFNLTRIYVSFGTIAHRYYAPNIEQFLRTIATAAVSNPHAEFTIALGGAKLQVPGYLPANVRIESFVDQWIALARSDVYITHNGLNSTHEAVYLRKPMISYPLFADQPSMAKRCEELGLAVPLVEEAREAAAPHHVSEAVAKVLRDKDAMQTNQERAKTWEDAVIANRPCVIKRILDCA